jgi:ABC-type polysaccharide/polyol phosphate transport system ATPase subunit
VAHISLQRVVVDFPIVNASSRSLQLRLFQALGGKLSAPDRIVVVRALDGIDLELKDGDRLGLIGDNGSGKTTLLRVLAGVYPPGYGSTEIAGSISSFTDITLGMDPEATGWENIIFRCAFMGLTFQEAKRLSPAIAEFSELGDYLELPTRTYSTGMFLRLAFAISTSIEPDILIMDEMIAAGDAHFIEKAKRRLHELIGKANILALASHDMPLIRNLCNKVVWLDHGVIKQAGSPEAVTATYLEASG